MNTDWPSTIQPSANVMLSFNEARQALCVLYRADFDRIYLEECDDKRESDIRSKLGKPVLFQYADSSIGWMTPFDLIEPKSEGNDGNQWMLWFDDWNKSKRKPVIDDVDVGAMKARRTSDCHSGRCETAFYEEWMEYSKLRHCHDLGVLETLMSGDVAGGDLLTLRDKRIAARLMQWLGTNVGRGFLVQALRRAGISELNKL
jgi:hypothetical protein